jgi:hypothetical protein
MIKDTMGNELKEGDLVMVQLERPIIFGRIAEVAEGGIITGVRGNEPQMKLSRVVVLSHHPIDTDPRIGVVPSLVKLYDPTEMSRQIEEVKTSAPN